MSLNIEIRDKFIRGFENYCFQLIIEAYKKCLIDGHIRMDWLENDITSELQRNMETDPKRFKWRISTNVEHHLSNLEEKREKGFSNKFPRIDLRFASFNSNLEYMYFLEAKILKEKSTPLKRRYINTGINNFTSKKYSNGCLVGYLLEGKLGVTVQGINALLKKDNREKEYLRPRPFIFYENYYESEHEEIKVLKHLIFDFTTIQEN